VRVCGRFPSTYLSKAWLSISSGWGRDGRRALPFAPRASGSYRQSIQLINGRFAMLDDGVGFTLVPWRPVIEKRLGQHLSAVIQGSRVSCEVGRSRMLSL
jgi:hypothetical protein